MTYRRHLLAGAAALAGLGAGAGLLVGGQARGQSAANEYRALVVVFLMGGNDGHNVLVPTDAGYADYQNARANLALSKASLVALPGLAQGRPFGLHPGLSELVSLYAQQRLTFVANAGPLVVPATAAQVRANAVAVPPFLLSHSDQQAMQQGWAGNEDLSGWAGRGLELLPSELRHSQAGVTLSRDRTLVQGRRSPVTFMGGDGPRYWGSADIAHPEREEVQAVQRMARWQFANAYEAEFAKTLNYALADSVVFTQAIMQAKPPAADFGSDTVGDLGSQLRHVASVLPYFKSAGYRRQVFFVPWGQFDTHANQRGTSQVDTQDSQLPILAKALAAFDQTNRANGLDLNVLTAVMSDFGRTVRPGSGGGSEHAWGNHFFVLGGPVAGGTVLGTFPSPVLGGPDDGDLGNNGRHVPTIATDQVAATLLQWMGLEAARFGEVFPHLGNFTQKTLPLLRS